MKKRYLQTAVVLFVFCLLLTACGGGAKAASMWLRRTEGDVSVKDASEKEVAPAENLGIFSGYQIGTQAQSFAWLDLDRTKLAKLDEQSEAAITKEGSSLSVNMQRGNLFFNITEPLQEGEALDIRVSNMLVGIRGTCGWVELSGEQQMDVYILEGTVTCTAGTASARLDAGMMAVLDGAAETVTLQPFSRGDVPDFVKAELTEEVLAGLPDGTPDGADSDETETDGAEAEAASASPQQLLETLRAGASDGANIPILQIGGGGGRQLLEPDEVMGFLSGALVDFDGDGSDGLITVSGESALTLLVETYDKDGQKVSQVNSSFYGSGEYGGGDSTFDVLLFQDAATQQWSLLFRNTINKDYMHVFEASLYAVQGDGLLQYQDGWYWDDISGTGGLSEAGIPDELADELSALNFPGTAANPSPQSIQILHAWVTRDGDNGYLHFSAYE